VSDTQGQSQGQKQKVVLAYSGGLDTSVAVHWLRERGYEVVTLTADLGGDVSLEASAAKARSMGCQAFVVDAREEFVTEFVWPALQAGALYGGRYPLATALGRPLIARLLVETAHQVGATAIAHGCTGKGNDQVRFDVTTALLDPSLTVIAPVREWDLKTRDEEIEYAQRHNIPIPVTKTSPYSIDENLWGRSIEAGPLEDPWQEPPADAFAWTVDPADAPAAPRYVEIGFEQGVPTSLDGTPVAPVELVTTLSAVAGQYGVGRIDQIEDRLVGIKSREIYEAPAAVVLHAAHQALEDMVLTRDAAAFKRGVADTYARSIYDGAWYAAFREDLAAYVTSTQRYVTGTVCVKLQAGAGAVVGRRSPYSLYQANLATYGSGDLFAHNAAEGFIQLWGLPLRVQAVAQPRAIIKEARVESAPEPVAV